MQEPKSKVIYEDEVRGPNKEERILGAISYVPFGFILPHLLGLGNRPYVLFHLKQGFFLFALYVIAWILPIKGISAFAALPYLILIGIHSYQAYHGKLFGFSWMSWLHDGTDPLSEVEKIESSKKHTPPKN